ncbi:glycyl-tRNA synthetase subunit beta [Ligilactobacillus acidipiscis DSM 15836]|uniref:Glycine--tRNA ligase beta subunit n=1 Tax=Ligilactobacillus acidipiscis DSM 15836 TaxID=1423716 RepID=A0ABR5PIU2_9LACO|nr:glycine--tRNA ligase subunit beta [Ligilactobacillus acidipiscis]KRM26047.1 glycyl-tRNA synthetase subunit beta [Ligilactobacillus acidipiscis DSM 15836]GAW64282.1 glycyl-tRNA synthetase beta chain [Ligilactobacillus acidipiscis]GEN21570.1 glycine--tRNA ligase beta subunit [Ligilactobacillus acidipiscis]
MKHTFLLEIGLEEIPAHVVTPSVAQLATRMKDFLNDSRISFDEIQTYSTPRRLAVKVLGLADKQPDIKEEAKGPVKKIAIDDQGNWSKAAQGFSRGQGVDPDQIYFKEFKGTEYAYVEKSVLGKPVTEVLTAIDQVITAMRFPTMMRWSTNDFEFVRPIRWLVCLLDEQVIPVQILQIKADRISAGHRFLGQDVSLAKADDYPAKLVDQMVIADAKKRKDMIRTQIAELARKNDWQIVIDEDLLEEVNNLVEYPTVFAGSFDKKYLSLPDEVLITSMKDHQRFFYVLDHNDQMLSHFVSVRNGNDKFIENVVAGNEKVLTARLEDARFFYEEDQKRPISASVERLNNVMFHDKIGTIYAKMQRVTSIAEFLGQKVELTATELQNLKRAAQIYKFDIVTEMVGEFAELQGVMGEIYARLFGENESTAVAIKESYMPLGSESELPQTNVGAILSVADKLDSIQSFFAAGMLPSGSNDPYALRRQALGIVRIVLAKEWNLSVIDLAAAIDNSYQKEQDLYTNTQPSQNKNEWQQFIMDRVHQLLSDQNYAYDIVNTVVESSQNTFQQIFSAADVLTKHQTDSDFKENIEALTRTVRLARKGQSDIQPAVKESLFENDSEKNLFTAFNAVAKSYANEDLEEQYAALASLREPISEYFDETMVMVDDQAVKNNRLTQLANIAKLTYSFGSLDNLNVK